MHPLSFVVDEIKPVSRWREYGYPSASAAALDWGNLQAAHYCCNASKGNRAQGDKVVVRIQKTVVQDGIYMFSTHNNGKDTVKSPMGLFEQDLNENDLKAVDDAIREYWSVEIE